MNRTRALLCATALSVALGACASREDMTAIEAAAEAFHAELAEGDARTIHDTAAEAYRQTTSFEQSERLVAFFKPRLAPCEPPVRVKNNVSTNYSTSGNFVTVVYQRQCPLGVMTETLTFLIKDDVATLAGFNFNGDQIMSEPAAPVAPAPTSPAPAAPDLPPASPPTDAKTPI